MKMKTETGIFLLLSLVFVSCTKTGSDPTDTPTSGDLSVSADENIQPLVTAQVNSFMGVYKNSRITAKYGPEADVISDLINDSCKVAFIHRKLTDDELAIFKKQTFYPRTTLIAIDAIAIIVNKKNPDSLFTVSQIGDILTGKVSNWKQLNGTGKSAQIKIVFDSPNSSNVQFMKDSVAKVTVLPENCFALNSNTEVLTYVKAHPDALGIIGVNWISDADDSTASGFYKSVSVAGISNGTGSDPDYYQPYTAYIALKKYPFSRKVYAVSREARMGLGTGFIAWVASDRGQRIVLKSGLLPATMPVRLVEIY